MKRRLRKKRHLGEFVEHCFNVSGELRPLDGDEEDRFLDELIEFVVPLGLGVCGGTGPGSLDVVVSGHDLHRCASLSFPPASYRGPIMWRSVWKSRRKIPERRHGARDATEEHRAALAGFLEQHPRVVRFNVGQMVDAWKEPEDDPV